MEKHKCRGLRTWEPEPLEGGEAVWHLLPPWGSEWDAHFPDFAAALGGSQSTLRNWDGTEKAWPWWTSEIPGPYLNQQNLQPVVWTPGNSLNSYGPCVKAGQNWNATMQRRSRNHFVTEDNDDSLINLDADSWESLELSWEGWWFPCWKLGTYTFRFRWLYLKCVLSSIKTPFWMGFLLI